MYAMRASYWLAAIRSECVRLFSSAVRRVDMKTVKMFNSSTHSLTPSHDVYCEDLLIKNVNVINVYVNRIYVRMRMSYHFIPLSLASRSNNSSGSSSSSSTLSRIQIDAALSYVRFPPEILLLSHFSPFSLRCFSLLFSRNISTFQRVSEWGRGMRLSGVGEF